MYKLLHKPSGLYWNGGIELTDNPDKILLWDKSKKGLMNGLAYSIGWFSRTVKSEQPHLQEEFYLSDATKPSSSFSWKTIPVIPVDKKKDFEIVQCFGDANHEGDAVWTLTQEESNLLKYLIQAEASLNNPLAKKILERIPK